MRKNPAIWISVIGAALALAVGFGLKVSGVQVELIMDLAALLVPLIMGGTAIAIRSQVYSPDSVQTALNMPPESKPALLDRVLAAGVEVQPGDTHLEVVKAVNTAEASQ